MLSHALVATAEDNGSPASIALPNTVDLVAGRLYTLWVETSAGTISVTGVANDVDAQSWELVDVVVPGGNGQWTVFRCEADANVTNTTITATFSAAGTGAAAILVETTGQTPGHNGALAIVQKLSEAVAGSASSITITLPDALQTGNHQLAGVSYVANADATAGGDSTLLGTTSHNTPNRGAGVVSDDDNAADISWGSSVGHGYVAFEIEEDRSWDADLDAFLGSVTDTDTLTTTAAAAAGTRVVMFAHWYGTDTITGATDDEEGLTWVVDVQSRIGGGNENAFAILSADAPAGLTSGAVITPTWSGSGPSFGPGLAAVSFAGLEGGSSGYVHDTSTGLVGGAFDENWRCNILTIDAPKALIGFSFANIAAVDHTPQVGTIEVANWTTEGSNRGAAVFRRGYAADDYSFGGFWSDPGQANVIGGVAVAYDLDAGGPTAYTLDCDPGTFTITGAATDLLADRLIEASPGSYAITGADMNPDIGMALDPGSYAVTGAAAGLLADRVLDAQPGAYDITGLEAVFDIALSLDPGAFTITGVDATLEEGGGGGPAAYELNCEPGAFSITGATASLVADRLIDAEPGSFVVTGANATLSAARVLNAMPGSFVITGVSAGILTARQIVAAPGSYVITGAPVTFEVDLAPSYALPAVGDVIVLTAEGNIISLQPSGQIIVNAPEGEITTN